MIEATHGVHLAAQLSGWGPVSAAEWKLRSPRTFFNDGFEINGDSLAVSPALPKGIPPNTTFPTRRMLGRMVIWRRNTSPPS